MCVGKQDGIKRWHQPYPASSLHAPCFPLPAADPTYLRTHACAALPHHTRLLQAGQLLTLGSGAAYPSLNLSHAVATVLHRWHELQAPPAVQHHPQPEPCQRQEIEAMLGDAENLLLEVGFLHRHTAQARMAKLRGLLQRAQIREAEVALIRGMVRQLRWATTRRTP